MVGKSKKSTEELPKEWIQKLKTSNGRSTKVYTNLETGQIFNSKADVMRYINRESSTHATSQLLSLKSTPEQPNPKSTPEQPSPKSTPEQPNPKSTPEQPSPKSTPEQPSSKNTPEQPSRKSTPRQPSRKSTPRQPSRKSTPRQPSRKSTRQPTSKSTRQPSPKSTRQPSQRNRSATKDEPKKEAKPVTTNKTEDWLPSGWTVELKSSRGGVNSSREYKIYIDPSTGQKFYTKQQVLLHLKIAERGGITSKRKRRSHGPEDNSPGKPNNPENGSPSKVKKVKEDSINKEKETVDDSPAELEETPNAPLGDVTPTSEWLPSEWKTEIKRKNTGRKYKCYIDPTTGSKFYSKPEVIRHLNSEQNGGISLPEKQKEVTSSHGKPKKKFVIERGTPDKLPPGWIKEIKIERKGGHLRKDPYYTDPKSGYVFRSQNDALRYIKTKDINDCAIKPRKRHELQWLSGDISPSPAAAAGGSQKSQVKTTKRGRSEDGGKQTDANSGTLETKSDNGRSAKRPRRGRSSNKTTTNDETLDDITSEEDQPITPPSPPPKSQSLRKSTSSRKRSNKTGNTVSPMKSSSDEKRTSGRKKIVVVGIERTARKKIVVDGIKPTAPSRSSRRISAQLKPEAIIDQPTSTEAVLPVQAEPISSFRNNSTTVGPSLAETLNDALGIDLTNEEEMYMVEEEETQVENSPIRKDETTNNGLFQFGGSSGVVENFPIRKEETTNNDLFQFGNSSWHEEDTKEPESEPEHEPEPTWLDRPLDLLLKDLSNEHPTAPAAPDVQDYFRQEDAANKKEGDNHQHQHDLGAPGFTNFNFLNQANNHISPSSPDPATGPFNFLQSSNISPSPANPLFHSGIVPSPANPLFPPNNNQSSPPPPANPKFPPGGFGFQ